MAEQNYTIFQRLGIILGPNNENKRRINRPQKPVDPLLVTTSPEEFKQTKTELQQQKYINDLWGKVENDMYARSIHNEPTRMAAYYDFESMEFFPEIAAALDIMSEEACLVGTTQIPLLNGETKTIEELYNNSFSNFWCYGVKIDENKIKPTLVEKVIYKGEKDVYKIILDDGTEIKSTGDHKWLDYGNNWIETKDLINGSSLKSIYVKKNYKGYEKVSLNDFYKDYQFTHILVAEDQLIKQKNLLLCDERSKEQKIVIHHKSFNKNNNNPNELEYMLWDEHQKLHTDLNRERWDNPEFANKMKKIFSETAKKTWSIDGFREKRKKIMSEKMKNHYQKMDSKDRKRIHGFSGDKNLMYGSNRTGSSNPNWNKNKNHLQDINQQDYINYIISVKGDRRGKIEKHFNLTKKDVTLYNKIICEKYSIPYIQDIDFIFKIGFNLDTIKDFIKGEKNPYRSMNKYCKKYNLLRHDLLRFLNKKGYRTWGDLINTFGNHRVISVEYCGKEKVYDLFNSSVDSTFAVKCNNGMIISHNCVPSEQGKVLTIFSESERVRSILQDLFNKVLDIETNLQAWTRNTPIRQNSIIPLLNGESITIKDLSERVKNGDDVWTYSIQDKTKKVVPGKIIWCDLTRKNSELYRITLDDNTYVETTPDHPFMLRDGSFKNAEELKENDSLMPFYTTLSKDNKVIKNYEKVYDPSTGRYKYTHRVVSHEFIDLIEESKNDTIYVTHHKDFNKLNNNPSNLVRMTSSEHSNLHIMYGERGREILKRDDVKQKRMLGVDKYLRSDKRKLRLSEEMKGIYPKYFEEYNNSNLHGKHNIIRKNKMLDNWTSTDFKNKTISGMTIVGSEDCLEYITNIIKNNDGFIGINKLSEMLKIDGNFINLFKKTYKLRKDIVKSINSTTLNKIIFRQTNQDYFEFIVSIKPELILDKSYIKAKAISYGKKNSKILNHKVLSVVKLDITDDVYCMEVVGPNGEQDRHNFPICSFDMNGNYTRNGVFVSNCKYGDNFIYLHLEHGEGVVGCTQLPTIEIERFEDTDLIAKKKKIRFQYKTKDLQFEPFQIAHFRLLGDDRKLPYGTSILEKARRIYRQLVMSEDAMLIYRVVRAPERRVFKVFVGNMEDTDIEAYIQKIANKFKRTPIVDSKTGQIDLRYNQAGIDQDWFIPVRSESNQTVIDTLPGAQPLPIDDIEYLQKKLFAAIRVPAPFLGFGEAVGDGKNLSLLDIRFSRTVNRIQKAMIQELNKIAIIHLFMLGYEEELDNFTLALTNPSTQAELLKIELWSQKLDVYSKAMADAGNGFSAISMVRAKKEILGMSDEEIALDLQQQRIEKAAAAELANTASVIPKTGVFDKVDRIYGVKPGEGGPVPAEGAPEANNEFGGGPEIGGFGGGASPFGGGTETGGEAPGVSPDTGAESGGGETPPPGGPEGVPQESFIPGKHKPLITEKLISKTDTYNREIKEMIEKIDKSIL